MGNNTHPVTAEARVYETQSAPSSQYIENNNHLVVSQKHSSFERSQVNFFSLAGLEFVRQLRALSVDQNYQKLLPLS